MTQRLGFIDILPALLLILYIKNADGKVSRTLILSGILAFPII